VIFFFFKLVRVEGVKADVAYLDKGKTIIILTTAQSFVDCIGV
jgi:hypothetical protein